MRKAAILISTLLLAACVAFGQDYGYGSQDSQTTQSTQSSAGKNETLRGCLSKQGSDFYLTTLGANQQRYEITGNTAKLAAHVGHEMAITGRVENSGSMANNSSMSQSGTPNGNNSNMAASNNGEMNETTAGTISLEKFQHISATCPK